MESRSLGNNKLLLHLLKRKSSIQQASVSQGFTLIELLVVIVILGVLGAVGYQAYLQQLRAANAGIARNTATALAKNCAALRVTGDASFFDASGFAGSEITTGGACATDGVAAVFSVTAAAGGAGFLQTNSATVTTTNSVTPAPNL